MKPQFDHNLISAFGLWLDHRITSNGQGYVNYSGFQLFPQTDTSSPFPYIYASPHKQWVYDSSVTGNPLVISGVYNSNGTYFNRASGISIDFINGRVLSNINLGQNISGFYSRKEYNVYNSTPKIVNFYLESLFGLNENVALTETGVLPYNFAAPCVIFTNSHDVNEPFAFGGQDRSVRKINAIIISDNNYAQEAVSSLLTDAARLYIPYAKYGDVPINSYGDLKTGYYSYNDIISKYGFGDIYIDEINSIKLPEKFNKNDNFMLQILEFDVSVVRFPRAETY